MSEQDAIQAALALAENSHTEGLYEPCNEFEARAAIRALIGAYESIPGSFREGSERTRSSTAVMSDDPLQGISEVIQNADDHGASRIVVTLTNESLSFQHDGQPGQLANVHALGVPYLTTNRDREDTTGRFGIGLSTLQSLAPHFEFHSGHYNVRVGDPYLSLLAPVGEVSLGTLFRVPLEPDVLSTSEFVDWFERWDHAGLMFLANVRHVEFVCEAGPRKLSLKQPRARTISPKGFEKCLVEAPDGRAWNLYSRRIESPPGVTRRAKKTGLTTAIQIALPLQDQKSGHLYAGLPVEQISLPVLINAQFDPRTNRQGLTSSDWNLALAEPVAALWVDAMIDLFQSDAPNAWACVPSAGDSAGVSPSNFNRHLTTVLRQASAAVGKTAEVPSSGVLVSLANMHAEVALLDEYMSSADISTLRSGTALPAETRDRDGRWREVWQGWIDAEVAMQPLVTLQDALPLLSDPTKDAEWTISFHALAITNNLGRQTRQHACLIDADSQHFVLTDDEIGFLSVGDQSGLAATLGICRPLSAAYVVDSPAAHVVRQWLTDGSYLIDAADPIALLQRIASVGKRRNDARGRIEVNDEQLIAIRDAMEPLGRDVWQTLGPGIGAAILLRGFEYDAAGAEVVLPVSPSEAYLPRQIDREPLGFHAAAGRTPGLRWVAANYGTILRSSLGRHGLGVQRFLGVLGCTTSPRVTKHRSLQSKYQDRRRGLALYPPNRSRARSSMLSAMRADYTLDDLESADLDRVCRSIANEPDGTRRRARAKALLAVLGRSWTNEYSEISTVSAARAYQRWVPRGTIRAFWIWRLGEAMWLDNTEGVPRAPVDLCIRTDANLALHGPDHADFLHADFADFRSSLLEDIGLAPEPTVGELLVRLDELHDQDADAFVTFAQTLTIYQALSSRLSLQTGGEINAQDVQDHFQQGRPLINTGKAWVHARDAFRGSPILGHYRNFAPEVPGRAERLWLAVGLKLPTALDCIDVLTEIASANEEPDAAVIAVQIDTFRYLASLEGDDRLTRATHKKLARLPIWTTSGWVQGRPIYALSNTLLGRSLGAVVPVWLPNADITQFLPLLKPLSIERLDDAAIGLLPSTVGKEDEALTDLFRDVVQAMHTDFALNDMSLAHSVVGTWSELEDFKVLQCDSVSLSATRPGGGYFEFNVGAHADRNTKTLYVTDAAEIEERDGAPLALATLFEAPTRSILLGWYKALAESRSRIENKRILLASERQAQSLAANVAAAENLAKLQEESDPKRKPKKASAGAPKPPPSAPTLQEAPRSLNDPAEAEATTVKGDLRLGTDPPTPPGENKDEKERPLKKPRGKNAGKTGKPRLGRKEYSPEAKEDTGMAYARLALAAHGIEIEDIRDQHGVGADAVDVTGTKYFELKVSAKEEPASVTLERSQVQRANADRENFYLVIVSGVEQGSPVTRVRIVADPLQVLTMSESTKIRLSDIGNNAHTSLVHEYSNPPLAD